MPPVIAFCIHPPILYLFFYPAHLKEFYNFDKYTSSRDLCEEVLLESVKSMNVTAEKSSLDNFDSLFNCEV